MTEHIVADLVAQGVLLVEDGNHGEYRPRPDEFVAVGVPFIRAADMSNGVVDFLGAGKINATARARIRKGIGAPGDVILSHKGTVGRIAVAANDAPDFVCSPQTTFWRSLDPNVLDQRFLRYVMGSASFIRQLDVLKGQTDMAPYVSLSDQRSMTIELPDIEEQRAIAEVLGALDDKIAANERLLVGIDRLVGAQYDAHIEACSTQLPLERIAIFHNRRRIPLSSREREVRRGNVPYYGAAGRLDFVDEPLFDEPLVLVGEDGSVVNEDGSPVVQYIWGPSWVNNHAHVLTGNGIATETLRFALLRSNVTHLVTGAVQPKISMGNLKKLMLEVPKESALFDEIAAKFAAVTRSLSDENKVLARTRDALLPLLMSGKIRVKDAEASVSELV